MSLRLWLYLGAALAAVALIAGAYFEGKAAGGNAMARKFQIQLDRMAVAQGKADRAAAAIDLEAVRADGARQVEVREIRRDAIRVVEREVYRGTWADADGVGLLRRAVAAANGEPGSAAGGGTDGRAAPVRGAAGQPGR